MTYYRLFTNDEDFSIFHLPDEKDSSWFVQFAKNKFYLKHFIKEEWQPFIILEKEVKKLPDFALLNNEFFIISERAKSFLQEIFDVQIELLPLINDVQPYYLLRVLPIDALDHKRAVIKRLPYSNKILRILYYSFNPEKITHIFKIPENSFDIFISEEFIRIYEENNLTGLEFTEDEIVWNYDPKLRN